MIDTKKSIETPWGLSWADLLPSLHPPSETLTTIANIQNEISTLLTIADIPHILLLAGSHGRNTALPTDKNIDFLVQVPDFTVSTYHTTHLQPLHTALKPLSPRLDGIHTTFPHSGFTVSLTLAAHLYHGPQSLLTAPADHAEVLHRTSCECLRVEMVRLHSPHARDMCRVAKKWLADGGFLPGEHTPSDYLTELLMLHAVRETPYSDKPHEPVFRSFLSLLAGASGVRNFLMWEWYYPRRAVDDAIAAGVLDLPKGRNVVVVDPAAPGLNLAAGVDWGDVRAYARKSLDGMRSTELMESLQLRLAALTKGVEESINALQRKVDHLESLSAAPRRWAGVVQFGEPCMASDAWSIVTELDLRGLVWRVNARRARGDGGGYSGLVDVSLQVVGRVKGIVDVDVMFRGGVTNLVYDDKVDHVLIAKKSEVVRNRDYTMQITVVS